MSFNSARQSLQIAMSAVTSEIGAPVASLFFIVKPASFLIAGMSIISQLLIFANLDRSELD